MCDLGVEIHFSKFLNNKVDKKCVGELMEDIIGLNDNVGLWILGVTNAGSWVGSKERFTSVVAPSLSVGMVGIVLGDNEKINSI